MKTVRFTFMAAAIILLHLLSYSANAQVLRAWSSGADNYNMPGSTGVPFYINTHGHWECIGSGHSTVFVSRKCNFSIPAGATILGINVSCDVIISNMIDSSIVLLKKGIPHGSDGAHRLPIVSAPDINWGSDTSLWGGSWTPADLNDTDFGFRFVIREINSTNPFGWADANGLYVRVAYQLASGIRETQTAVINIYPNPAEGQVNLNFSKELKNAKVSVRNLSGQVVKDMGMISGNAASINISEQPAGMYWLEAADEGTVSRAALIKR